MRSDQQSAVSDQRATAGGRRTAAALVGFVLLALAFTYPLWLRMGTELIASEDPQLNRWILAWDAHALLTEPARLFDANIFYPYPVPLAYSENLLGSALLGLPLQLLFGNPTATYGILNLLNFALCGFGAYLLGRRISGRAWAGVIAGVIFAFCPYMMSQIGHFQNLTAQWMPFAFLALDRAIVAGRRRDYCLFGLFSALQALASVYYALFLAVGVALFAGVALPLRWWSTPRILLRRLLGVAVAGVVAAGVVLPVFLPYQKVVTAMDAGRSLSYVTQLSPDALNYLAAPDTNILYGRLTASLRKYPEGSLLPGVLATLLGLAGLVAGLRAARRAGRPTLVAFAVLAVGAGVLSLGPTVQVAGNALARGPYYLLWRYVPGFTGVRVPGRLAVLVMLGVAVLAAAGAAWLLERLRPARRGLAFAAIALILGLEYACWPWPTEPVGAAAPAAYAWLAQQPDDFALVELPIDVYPAADHDIRYISASTLHWKRLVNGYSGYFPAGYLALTKILQGFPDAASLTALRRLGVRYALAHQDEMPPAQRAAIGAALEQGELQLAGDFGTTQLYALGAEAAGGSLTLGVPEARPFLLRGWSADDGRAAGQSFVWNEEEEGGLFLPAGGEGRRAVALTARSAAGETRCSVWLDDAALGVVTFHAKGFETRRLDLVAPVGPGVQRLHWRCAGGAAPALSRQIGSSGATAPIDLAAAAGAGYADVYAAGKRYSVSADCATCAGLLALRGGSASNVRWRQADLAQADAAAKLQTFIEKLPAGSIIVFAAQPGAEPTPALLAALARFGATSGVWPTGAAYVLLGARGATAGAAIEAADAEDCWRYVGQPWPARRLAVARVEWLP